MTISLPKKIFGGFLFATLVSIVVGVVGWGSTTLIRGKMDEMGTVNLPSHANISEIASHQSLASGSLQVLLNPARSRQERALEYQKIESNFKDGNVHIQIFASLPKNAKVEHQWKAFLTSWKIWQSDMDEALRFSQEIDKLAIDNPQNLAREAEHFFGTYKAWAATVSRSVLEGATMSVSKDAASLEFGKWLIALKSDNPDVTAAQGKVINELGLVLNSVTSITDFLEIEEPELAKDVYVAEVLPSIESIQYLVDDLMSVIKEALDLYEALYTFEQQSASISLARSKELLDSIAELVNEEVQENLAKGAETSQKAQRILIIVIVGGTIISLAMGLVISRNIILPIRSYIIDLTGASMGIGEASQTFTESGQRLANDASMQASGIEQTSASIEEIASMSRQNADNANQASTTMDDTKEMLGQMQQLMSGLTTSMQGINTASSETAKIIKSIDEIAFQTNLLALNAAVEAARAGEAGAGFAVVAEEVRNLAMRAAKAARNTAELIEGTVSQVESGSDMVEKTAEAFGKVSSRIQDSCVLVSEINAASNEQAKGIEQINTSIAEIESITQQNAANADGYFRTSVKMETFSANLKEIVQLLTAMVGGASATTTGAPSMLPQQPQEVLNCWEFKKCGREEGGSNAESLGVCPAYPDHGQSCAELAGTLCGGEIQGSYAQKIANCQQCEFYRSENYIGSS